MYYRNRIFLSLTILCLSAGIVLLILLTGQTFPTLSEELVIRKKGIFIQYAYSYTYTGDYPVSIQKIILPRENDKILSFCRFDGRPLSYFIRQGGLVFEWGEEITPGDRISIILKTRVVPDPYLNVVQLPGGKYQLNYTSVIWRPSRRSRKIIFPGGSHIVCLKSSSKYSRLLNTIECNATSYSPQTTALLAVFSNKTALNDISLFPGPLFANGKLIFRFSKKYFTSPPLIRGDFSSSFYIRTSDAGQYFQYATNLPPGQYKYQIHYHWVDLADAGNTNSDITKDGSGFSRVIIKPVSSGGH